jgi:peptidoglycan/LPS O-acetylase OafA/YrhL
MDTSNRGNFLHSCRYPSTNSTYSAVFGNVGYFDFAGNHIVYEPLARRAVFLFSSSVAYIPFLIIGQIVYLFLHAKKLNHLQFSFIAGIQYLLLIWGLYSIHVNFLPTTNSYTISAIYALVIFLGFYRLPPIYLRMRFFAIMADHSYSIYLFHAVVGVPVLVFVFAKTASYPASLFCTISATAVVSALGCRLVEQPFIKLGRKLSALLKQPEISAN